MTEPDEARARTFAELSIRCGKTAGLLEEAREEAVAVAEHGYKIGYRAGQAASAERIKALEEEIAAMQEITGNLRVEMSDMLTRLHELHPEDFVWLKEADQ